MASRGFLVAVSGAKIYVTANPLRSDGHSRTKDSIATVRHPSLDFDSDGEVRLTSVWASDTVPTPTAILSTSLGDYQILWRVNCFNFERQEGTLKRLAIPYGGDPACMDGNRTLRWPGFRNCENDPSYPITVKYPCDSISNPGDFRLDIPAANALPLPHAISSRKHPGKHTYSEHDGAWILHELDHGKDAAKLMRTIASRRPDNSRPLYLRPAEGQRRIGQTLPHRRRSDGGRLSRCWRSAAAPRLPLHFVSERAQARMRWSRLRRRLQPGVESMPSVAVLKA
jgi:DNA primase RepB-like protein